MIATQKQQQQQQHLWSVSVQFLSYIDIDSSTHHLNYANYENICNTVVGTTRLELVTLILTIQFFASIKLHQHQPYSSSAKHLLLVWLEIAGLIDSSQASWILGKQLRNHCAFWRLSW